MQTLERRLPVRGVGDELDQVVDAFNGTLGRLEHAVGEMRQFSAALAHELRTPLAALRGEIELASRTPGASPAQRDRFASQMEEIDRLTRLIDHILTLARAESGQIRLTRAPVNLSELAASLVEQLEPIAAAKSIELRCEPSEAVVVDGDAGWLQRLLLNLVDNALKFTREHGRVVVRVTREDGDRADRGAGHRRRPVAGRCATGVRTILPGRSRPFLLHRRRRARPQPGAVDRGTASRNRHRSESPRLRARRSRSRCRSDGTHQRSPDDRKLISPSRSPHLRRVKYQEMTHTKSSAQSRAKGRSVCGQS